MKTLVLRCCLVTIMLIVYSPYSIAQVTDSGITVMSAKTDGNMSIKAAYHEQLPNSEIGNSVAQLKMGILLESVIKAALSTVDENKGAENQHEYASGQLQLELAFERFKDNDTQNWSIVINGDVISLDIARENPDTGDQTITGFLTNIK